MQVKELATLSAQRDKKLQKLVKKQTWSEYFSGAKPTEAGYTAQVVNYLITPPENPSLSKPKLVTA
jgi:hypothetical protein